jgi:histidinol-phosphate/aromatic aminotransferase/cobyric acid decarboxylase-like protein
MKPLRRRMGRGALVILALILASSGALRVGSGVGAALANSEVAESAAPLNCPVPSAAVAAALVGREEFVKQQELQLEERLAALALADQAISKRLAELQGAEEELK